MCGGAQGYMGKDDVPKPKDAEELYREKKMRESESVLGELYWT